MISLPSVALNPAHGHLSPVPDIARDLWAMSGCLSIVALPSGPRQESAWWRKKKSFPFEWFDIISDSSILPGMQCSCIIQRSIHKGVYHMAVSDSDVTPISNTSKDKRWTVRKWWATHQPILRFDRWREISLPCKIVDTWPSWACEAIWLFWLF